MSRSIRIVALAGTAACLGALTAQLLKHEPPPVPTALWTVSGNEVDALAEVGIETPLNCSVTIPRPSWVYAMQFDPTHGPLALFPSQQLRSDLQTNPQRNGSIELPGKHVDQTLSWHSGDAHGPVSYILVVSDSPLKELEAAMPNWRQVGNGAFPSRALLGTYAPRAGMEAVPPRSELPTEILREAHALQRLEHDGPMTELRPGIHVSVLRLQVRAELPATEDAVRTQVEKKFGDLMQGNTPPK